MTLSKIIHSALIGLLAILSLGFTYAHANESDSNTMVMYYHHDVRGDPVVVTDSSGSILWLESYRAYGASEPRVSSAGIGFGDNSAAESNNRLGYTGHESDGGSGLTYMKARYYDNLTGRFLSNDPVGFRVDAPSLFNRYSYAYNNPYRFLDPNGMEGEDIQSDLEQEISGTRSLWSNLWGGLGQGFSSGADVADEIAVDTYSAENAVASVFGLGLVKSIVKKFKWGPNVPKGLGNAIPEGKLANHIFSGELGKLSDTPANRKLITNLTNNKDNLLGTDRFGKSWFARNLDDGTQLYGYTQKGIVKGAGINAKPLDIVQNQGL